MIGLLIAASYGVPRRCVDFIDREVDVRHLLLLLRLVGPDGRLIVRVALEEEAGVSALRGAGRVNNGIIVAQGQQILSHESGVKLRQLAGSMQSMVRE